MTDGLFSEVEFITFTEDELHGRSLSYMTFKEGKHEVTVAIDILTDDVFIIEAKVSSSSREG